MWRYYFRRLKERLGFKIYLKNANLVRIFACLMFPYLYPSSGAFWVIKVIKETLETFYFFDFTITGSCALENILAYLEMDHT